MTEPPVLPDDAERREVLAELAARVVPASLRPPSLIAPSPLRPLPADVVAKVDARARAGLDPTGADHPRREAGQWVVVPAVLGTAAGITLIVALLISHNLLALISGLVFAASVITGVGLWAWVQADPMRVHIDERRALTNAHFWESRQQWLGAIHAAPERTVVGYAADLVMQIAASPAWNSPYLDAQRSRLDLTSELDQIDAQAHLSAAARIARPNDPAAEAGYLSLVDRVVGLRRYAQALDGLGARLATAAASLDSELRGGAFLGGALAGSHADAVAQLTSEVTYLSSSIDGQTVRGQGLDSHD